MITQKGSQDVEEDYYNGYPFFISEARNGGTPSIRAGKSYLSRLAQSLAEAAWQAKQSRTGPELEHRRAFGRYLWRIRLTQQRDIAAVATQSELSEEMCSKLERGLLDSGDIKTLFPQIGVGWRRSVQMLERMFALEAESLEEAEPQLKLRCRSNAEFIEEEVIPYDDMSQS